MYFESKIIWTGTIDSVEFRVNQTAPLNCRVEQFIDGNWVVIDNDCVHTQNFILKRALLETHASYVEPEI